jgi:TonB family protein
MPPTSLLSSGPSTRRRPIGRALGASIGFHAALVVAAIFVWSLKDGSVATQVPPVRTNLVYIAQAGPSGGGGGQAGLSAPQPMQIPRHQPPVAVTLTPMPTPAPPDPLPTLDARVETNLASMLQAAGNASFALPGPGNGGRGRGLGDGEGPGVNRGTGGEQGGGPRQIGGDVSSPALIKEVKPLYTTDAMAKKITGIVELEVVVLANGTVGRITVVKSLDPGLDQMAINAAGKWLFTPGKLKNGEAVDVIVRLILEFRLH